MSNTVDRRVVEMRFDNAQFERNARATMTTVEKLKQSLNFKGFRDNFDAISDSVRGVDFSGMEQGIGKVSNAFSFFGNLAFNVMDKINKSIADFVVNTAKSVSIEQVAQGWSKYEEKTNSVATIMSATGMSIEEVEKELEKLIWFADETSYSFTDMTSNVGKFTSVGVDLPVAVEAMEGIANWAALSGQNAQTASRAMYNLSQAMGVGSVKLMDWRSIENASMATKEFKEQAIETAKALKILNKEGKVHGTDVVVTYENFSSTLEQGWFTADVLLKTLEKYGNYTSAVYEISDSFDTCSEAMKNTSEEGMELGAKAFRAAQEAKTFKDAVDATADAVSSQWLTMFQTIFGNYEQAKVIWTELTNVMWDIFASPLDEINSVLKDWADTYYNIEYNVWTKLTNLEKEKYSDNWMSGRDLLIDNVRIAWEDLTKVLSTVSDAFDMVFDSIGTDELMKAIGGIRQFLVSLEISESTAISLRNGFYYTFQAIKNGINFVVDSAKTLFGVMSDVVKEFGIFDGAGDKLLSVFKTTAKGAFDFVKNLSLSEKFIENFKRTFSGIIAVVDIIKQLASALIGPLVNGFKIIGSAAVSLLGSIFGITGGLGDFLVKIDEFIKKYNIFGKVVGFFSDVLGSLGKIVLGVKNYIQSFINTLKFNLEKLGLFDGIEGIKKRVEQLKGYFQKLKDLINNFFNKSVKKNELSQQLEDTSKKADIFLRAGEKIKTVISDIYEKFRGFLDAHGFEGKTIIDIALDAINGFLGSGALIALWALISSWKSGGIMDILFGENGPFGKISKALGSNNGLAGVIENLKKSFGDIKNSVNVSLLSIKDTMQQFQNDLKANILDKIANAILKIAAACILLSFVDPVRLAASMGTITVAMGELMAALFFTKDIKGSYGAVKMTEVAVMVSALSTAMLKIAGAIFLLGTLKPEKLLAAVIAFSVIFAELGAMMYVLTAIPFADVTVYATAMVVMGQAMQKLAIALAILSILPTEKLMNSMTVMTGVLAELMVVMYVLTQMNRNTFNAAAMEMSILTITALTNSLMKICIAVALLAIVPVERLKAATIAIIAILAALTFVLSTIVNFPSTTADLTLIAQLITRMSVGLLLIAAAIKMVASVGDWKQIGASAGALIVTMFALVGAMALLTKLDTVSMSTVAPALVAMSASLLVMAIAMKVLASVPWQSLLIGIGAIALLLAVLGGAAALLSGLIGPLLAIAAAFTIFSVGLLAIGVGVGALGAGLVSVVGALFTLSKLGPEAAQKAMETVGVILQGLLKQIPTVVLIIGELMVGIAGLILQKIGLITAVVIAIISAICTALENSIIRIVTSVLRIISAILEAILEFAPTIILTGMKVLLMFLQGIADNIWQITNLVMEIIAAFLVGVASHIDEIIESAWTIMLAFIGGFVDHIDEMVILGVDFMVNFINGITEKIDDLIQAGVDLIFAFIDGLADAIEKNTPIFQEKMSHLFQVCIDAVLILLEGAIEDLKTAGRKIINSGFVEGIKEKIGLAKDKVSEMIDGIKQRIELKIESFKEAGKNIIQGLIDGIVSIKDTVVNTVEGVATDAIDAFKTVLGIQSPSKVFEECGYFIDKGAANGVAKNSNILDSAIEDAGNSAVDSMRGALSNLSGIVDGTMDTNPTITPILDLTNIQNGANSLNNMFDNQQVALAATGFNIASDYAAQNNAMTNFMKSIAKSNEEMTNRLEAAFNNSRTNITVESKLEPNSARFFKSMRSEAKFYNMQTGN